MLEKDIKYFPQSFEKKYNNAKCISWGNRFYIVSNKAVLTINCTERCNAYCFFCYNSKTFMKQNVYLDVESEKIRKILCFSRKAGIEIVSLTGGEPTLNPIRLIELADLCKKYGFKHLRLHTNGYKLLEEYIYKGHKRKLIDHLILAGVNELSISLASHKPEINKKIMNIESYEKVDEILSQNICGQISVRLSCYVCDIGIRTFRDMKAYIKWGEERNVNNFIFRMERKHEEERIEKNMLDFVKNFLKEGFRITFSHHKSDSYIYELKNSKSIITLNYAMEEEEDDKKIRRLIVMPDGIVYSSWINPASYLFPDEKKLVLDNCMNGGEMLKKQGNYPSAYFWKKQKSFVCNQEKEYPIDIHVHSKVSDGLETPCEVIEKMQKHGITHMVFTEHNCFHDNFSQLQKFAKKHNIDIPFQGVEINTVFCREGHLPYMKFHLLLYGINLETEELVQKIAKVNKIRNDYIREKYLEFVKKGLIELPFNEIYKITDLEAITQKKVFTRSLLAKEVSRVTGESIEEIKEKYIPQLSEKERYKYWIDIREILEMARKIGAVTVLAHPGWIRPFDEKDNNITKKELVEAIIDMRRWGLDGLEIRHRLNDFETVQLLENVALNLGMLITGGSDYHGRVRCQIGNHGMTKREFERLQILVNEREKLYER